MTIKQFSLQKKKTNIKSNRISFEGRSYKKYVKEQFQFDLQLINWNEFFEIEDPENAWSYLIEKIIECLEKTCPWKKFKINSYKEKWMNRDLMEKVIDKDIGLKKAKKTKKSRRHCICKKVKK